MTRPRRILVDVLLVAAVLVLTLIHVLPSRSSPNYWWVVLVLAVIALAARLYWRLTTGGWHNPRGQRQRL